MSEEIQAVRLPKALSLGTDEVQIRAEAAAVVPELLEGDWTWLADLHSLGPLDPDVVDAAELPATDRFLPDPDVLR